ncbi:MAG: NAD(P)H-dependent glycerol-3-phosphate dehydrogenase [Gammaproteobacteria bacterium]|jgi:glycerol-3-phosphate dehydrogenase (NAD(P)+)
MSLPNASIAVIGAGSWGTALAILLSRNGENTSLWARDEQKIAAMERARCNQRYLPDIQLPPALNLSADLNAVVNSCQDLLVVVPSHAFRGTLETLRPLMRDNQRLMWATKGFEPHTCKLLHEVVADVFGENIHTAVISGPTFAKEVAKGLPTAVTVASKNDSFAHQVAERLHDETFRAYTSDDVTGVEVGGCVKNVLAIAAGIADGLGFGANTRAALITRGLVEIMRLGDSVGGHRETFMGLAGLGDLVLTCTDNLSRNRRFGLAMGQGLSKEDALASIDQVVEGMQAAREVHNLATKLDVEMPITEQVYEVLYQNKSPREAVHDLLARQQKAETF